MSDTRLCIQYAEIFPSTLIALSAEDRKYLFKVLRYSAGDTLSVIDGKGKIYRARVIDKKTLEILYEERHYQEDIFSIFLCQGLLKGERMEMVIQKATEIGVKKIIPFVSERCIIKHTRKIERWKKIAKEATEQSGSITVPEINEMVNFSDLIKQAENGILFWENSEASLMQAVLELTPDRPIFLFIGPEGGFSPEEIQLAEKRGMKIASLGKRILRAETASIVSLALVNFLLQVKIEKIKL
uniref:Ribosomal RNA small subunit methyltransferase E n=1 Tax=Thermodesulfovibrio aggregans TaxID=86166 RepID=A0A7C4EPI7_9BACT